MKVECYRYSAFGEQIIYNQEGLSTHESINPWRFSSKRKEKETGFIYFGRRYYNPEQGRWMSVDPLGFEAGPNLYAYVMNSPLVHIDLYGLWGVLLPLSTGQKSMPMPVPLPMPD